MSQLRRREFVGVLVGAALWPLAARAQPPDIRVIGFLGPALDTPQHWIAAFRRGLRAEGFVEGQNVTIEYRSAGRATKELPELAADLVQRKVAVIFAGPPAALAAKRATLTIPVVFVSGGDPMVVLRWPRRMPRERCASSRAGAALFGSAALLT